MRIPLPHAVFLCRTRSPLFQNCDLPRQKGPIFDFRSIHGKKREIFRKFCHVSAVGNVGKSAIFPVRSSIPERSESFSFQLTESNQMISMVLIPDFGSTEKTGRLVCWQPSRMTEYQEESGDLEEHSISESVIFLPAKHPLCNSGKNKTHRGATVS